MENGLEGRGAARPRRKVVVVVVALCAIAVVAVLALRQAPERAELADVPDPGEDRVAAARTMLQRLERALDRRDRGAAAVLSVPAQDGARTRLEGVVDNVRRIDVRGISLRYLGVAPAVPAEGEADRWWVEARLDWRFPGERTSSTEVRLLLARVGNEEPVLRRTGPVAGERLPLWFVQPLAVRRGQDTLILAVDRREATLLARQAARARATVLRTLPGWDEPLVVQAPGSAAQFRAVSGLSGPAAEPIAAVTTTVDGSGDPGAPVHIVVNPTVFGPLGPRGRQIVISHEAAHVALDAPSTRAPLWLSEGIADYVALAGSPLPVSVLAAQIRTLVRERGAPRSLPGAAEFGGTDPDIGAWYEAAWLAARLVATQHGEQALLRLYRRTHVGGDVDQAFRDVLGTTQPAFVRQWRAELARLAR